MAQKTVQVNIPASLARRLEAEMRKSGQSDLSSFVTALLRQTLSSLSAGAEEIGEEEEKRIKERLRSLGYLD